jgi:cellulose synthase/poly-beta-1,6-N-acetylglucosamine synthase-like glycosyltransferase
MGWASLNPIDPEISKQLNVSVLIPVRNEMPHILELVCQLEKQSYPHDKYEVIIIDDGSEDGTYEALMQWSIHSDLNLKILKSENPKARFNSCKKAAITQGVKEATGDIILMTDGDVHIGEHWIHGFVNHFHRKDIQLISGPVMMESNGFLADLQSIEFASLIGTGAALIYYDTPILCNGANLAFRKKVFWEINGYADNEEVASGDDEFLMAKINKLYPKSVSFLKSRHCVVKIKPLQSFKDFMNQRRRWAGKWKKHVNINSKILAVYIFVVHVSFLLLILLLAIQKVQPFVFAVLLLLKLVTEYVFFKNIFKFFAKTLNIFPFVLSSLLYSLYAVTFGILANFGGYMWKGRHYKN